MIVLYVIYTTTFRDKRRRTATNSSPPTVQQGARTQEEAKHRRRTDRRLTDVPDFVQPGHLVSERLVRAVHGPDRCAERSTHGRTRADPVDAILQRSWRVHVVRSRSRAAGSERDSIIQSSTGQTDLPDLAAPCRFPSKFLLNPVPPLADIFFPSFSITPNRGNLVDSIELCVAPEVIQRWVSRAKLV